MLNNPTKNVIQFLMRGCVVLILVKSLFLLPVGKCSCPPETPLLRRLGNTRFYIVHGNERGNFVSFQEAFAQCTQHGLRMAKVKNMMTMALVGRELEKVVERNRLKDTWYWLDAKFNPTKDIYEWGQNGTEESVQYSNFLYRAPRPTGVAGFVNFKGEYHPNHDMDQCLTLSLPWPGNWDPHAAGVIYGHHTIFDERPCESQQRRHVICESVNARCKTDVNDPFRLTEDKTDYFERGNWIFGNRRYLINWKHRTINESQAYCESLGLELFKPEVDEPGLKDFLKMWAREVTTSQFWTAYTYRSMPKEFLTPGNPQIAIISSENKNDTSTDTNTGTVVNKNETDDFPQVRSNKIDDDFCVAMALAYELTGQLPCQDPSSSDCVWNFIDYVPANCNNYLSTICQHQDKESRESLWDPNYLKDMDAGLKATALTKDFEQAGNNLLLRSRYKQTFGILYCPPGYRMLRAKNEGWYSAEFFASAKSGTTFMYDLRETYWVVDQDLFNKDKDSDCTISEPDPIDGDGNKRTLKKVKCTEWHFYACEKVTNKTKMYEGVISQNPPQMVWREGPQPRVYPLLKVRTPAPRYREPGKTSLSGRSGGVRVISEDRSVKRTYSNASYRFVLKTVNETKKAFSLWTIRD